MIRAEQEGGVGPFVGMKNDWNRIFPQANRGS
jgi:hypothetical protein